jgi:hypothetical protein
MFNTGNSATNATRPAENESVIRSLEESIKEILLTCEFFKLTFLSGPLNLESLKSLTNYQK